MATDPLLNRAVESWEQLGFAMLSPGRSDPQPEQFALIEQISTKYRLESHREIAELVNSQNPIVVAYALTILARLKSPLLVYLPDELLDDSRGVYVLDGCMVVGRTVGDIAREVCESLIER